MAGKGHALIDMVGCSIGKLLVLQKAGLRNGHMHWLVRCECGVEKVVSGSAMRRGHQQSCGCGIRTHRLSKSTTYKSWQMMRQRCGNPATGNYRGYGAKGISVCERWERFESFVEDMGERPDGTSLDRIDGRGNYEAANCRWATRMQQAVNTTRWVGFSTLDGERVSISEMARQLAADESWLRWRIRTKGLHARRQMRLSR